jgi:hypothetical protein
LPDSEKLVLLALADWANDEGLCWPSIKRLADKCSKGERTISNALRMIETKGHIGREVIAGKGCRYTVHPIVGPGPRKIRTPATAAPLQGLPKTPATAAPNTLRTVISSEAKASSPYPPPPGVPDPIWSDFLKSPKRRKAGMSNTAYRGICNNLTEIAEHGFPPGQTIALAVERGWVTVKLEWVQNDRRTNGMAGHQSDGLSSTARAGLTVFGPG